MVEARAGRPIYRRHVLALLLPPRIDAAGDTARSNTCPQVRALLPHIICIFVEVGWGANSLL